MHAIWISFKDNVWSLWCAGTKVADTVGRPAERCNRRNSNSGRNFFDSKLIPVHDHGNATPTRELIHPRSYTRAELHELDIGTSSRNIIEMIVRRASMNPSKPSSRIKTVLRVRNSIATLEKFEKYREMVKKISEERFTRHLRSTVDGNELLRFYSTTMACCTGESKRVAELCKAPTCQVCRIIQSHFDTEYRVKNEIQLSTSSEDFSDGTISIARRKNVNRAVIVCRTIAGRIVYVRDKKYEQSDSIENQKLLSTSEYLMVRNPYALLPCFVIVFS